MSDKIIVYTDGGVNNNGQENNVGTWAYVLMCGDDYFEESGYILNTTNNVCEMMAVLKALQKLKKNNVPVIVYSDSKYVILGLTEWVKTWRRNNWKTSDKKDVKNKELWIELDTVKQVFYDITFTWIRGHSGNEFNERCDSLCRLTRDQYLKEYLGKFQEPKQIDDREEYERKKRNKSRSYEVWDVINFDTRP